MLFMKIYALMDKGSGKTICEDSVLIGHSVLSGGYTEWESDTDSFFTAVADGVGGNKGGAYASFYILSELRNGTAEDIGEAGKLKAFLEKSNAELIKYASNVDGCENMATTLTGIYVQSGIVNLFSVGNTRLFVVNGQFLRQLTTDHTKVADMVAMGMITREEAADRPDSNVINACMGNGETSYAKRLEVRDITDEAGKKPLLLTSDGIHDYLSPDEMEDIISGNKNIRERLTALKESARNKGSQDDISALWIEREENG